MAAQGRDLDAAWVDIKQLRERLDDMLKKSLDAIPAKAAILLTLLLGIANILIAVFHK